MNTRAKFVEEIKVTDPDTKGVIHLSVYKHENGGMFAMDSSFIEQELYEEMENLAIYDPFSNMGEPKTLYLEE